VLSYAFPRHELSHFSLDRQSQRALPRIAGAASGLLGFLQMMIAALGTFLIGRLPQHSALSMVIIVVASLALALVFGLLALRRPGAAPLPSRSVRLSPEVAKRS